MTHEASQVSSSKEGWTGEISWPVTGTAFATINSKGNKSASLEKRNPGIIITSVGWMGSKSEWGGRAL